MDYMFIECGCCGHYHRVEFGGDCRDNAHRFTADQIEAMHGVTIWEQVLDLDEQERQEQEMEDAL